MKRKVMAAQLGIVLLLGSVIYAYLDHALERYRTTEVTQRLTNEAALARLVAAEVKDLGAEAPELARRISREAKVRTTIISTQGEVLGDSEVPPEQLATLDNHAQRPEIRDALTSGLGSSIRYSETLRTDMLYVAVPLRTAAGSGAVLRLALPLSSLERAKREGSAVLAGTLSVAAFLLLLLSYLLSRVGTRSLQAVTAIAARIGKGELGTRVPVQEGSEVGELARVLNEMAAKTEEQLGRISAEKNRLDAILSGMGEGIMVADSRGTITLVNPAFRGLFGLKEEVLGKQLIEITRHPALHDSYRDVVTLGADRVEELQLGAPREKTVLTHWVPLVENGALQGVVAVFHDITDIRQMEKIRRDFVANVSHELRTPVAVIKGYAETLLSGVIKSHPEQADRFVGIIYSHAERLASLIGDLLTLSQLESGSMVLESRKTSVYEIAQHAVSLLEPKAHQKRISVDISGLADAPHVLADPGRLEQVLVNLVDNAIKYTPEDGTVTISAWAEEDRLAITVRDTGIGIPARDLPRIFERFYRVDTARSREEGGTGLGLAIVKHIVQLLGGTVAVESTGKGSCFTVSLRCVEPLAVE